MTTENAQINVRTISATDVKEWLGPSQKVRLSESQYRDVAKKLTRLRLSTDPVSRSFARLTKLAQPESECWWDFKKATAAAKMLITSCPQMKTHWSNLSWAPETRSGHQAIQNLEAALFAAMPYIEWPFGPPSGKSLRVGNAGWHVLAHSIAWIVIYALIEAGHDAPGISRNSVVVRVVSQVLIRKGYPHSKMITLSAIGMFLSRWDKTFGLTPRGIARLTTKSPQRYF